MTNTDTKQDELRKSLESQIKVAYTWGLRAGQLPSENDEREARVTADGKALEKGFEELMSLFDQYATTLAERKVREADESDLKYLLQNLPKTVEGRELSLVLDKHDRRWYIGYPNRDGDFSVGAYADDKDPEGAALNLFYQFDTLKEKNNG